MKVLKWLNTGIFPCTVLFSYQFDYDEIIKELKRKRATDWWKGIENNKDWFNDMGYSAHKRVVENVTDEIEKTVFYIIIKDEFKFTDYEYCKLAHEVLHICQFMLPDILNRDREYESEAYLHTHLMQQCLKAIRGK